MFLFIVKEQTLFFYVSNTQSHGSLGILDAGQGKYPAFLNTQ
jgi:hypothetical protein